MFEKLSKHQGRREKSTKLCYTKECCCNSGPIVVCKVGPTGPLLALEQKRLKTKPNVFRPAHMNPLMSFTAQIFDAFK